MDDDIADLRALYGRYLDCCNAHHFEQLGNFVAAGVTVNGDPHGLSGYIAGLRAVTDAFPDYRWDLRHLLVDGGWLSAHFLTSGTHLGAYRGVLPTGRTVRTQEFAMYRIEGGKIAEMWGTADNAALMGFSR